MGCIHIYLIGLFGLCVEGRSLQVSPTPILRIVDPSAAASLQQETIANASTLLSNTSLADLQSDNVTQRLQLKYRERKKQERLLLIQTQILQRLGMSRQPNITSPHISDNERKRMTKLFERMRHMRSHNQLDEVPVRLYAERLQSFYPSCSLPNNTDRDTWDNSDHFRVFYDVTIPRPLVTTEVSIVAAKLRLYKVNDLEVDAECASWEQNVSSLPRYNLLDSLMHSSTTCGLSVSVFQYMKPVRANKREKKRFVDSHTVHADFKGWVEFNVITSLNQWISNRNRNYGFDVEVEDAFGNRLIPSRYFRHVNCSDDYVTQDPPFPNIIELHPEMGDNESSLFNNETYPTLDLQTVELSREQPATQAEAGSGRAIRKRHANNNVRRNRCRRKKEYVTFRENGTMEKEPTLNRAGSKGSHTYIKNAENTTELIPLSGTETWHIEETALTEIDEEDPPSDTLSHPFLPQNDSFPASRVKTWYNEETALTEVDEDDPPSDNLPQPFLPQNDSFPALCVTEQSIPQSTRSSSAREILTERSDLSDKGTMDSESTLNRAGNKRSNTYKTNAVNATELIPLSSPKVKQTALNEVDETDQPSDTLSQLCLPQSDSYPVLCVTVPSTPDSTRSSSPQELPKAKAILSDNRAERGKIDNISISLSEYQLLASQGRKSSVPFNSIHSNRNTSESATEEQEATKLTILASQGVDAKEEEEQILEMLRNVVRKCTTLEPVKRPSSGLVHSLLFSGMRRNM